MATDEKLLIENIEIVYPVDDYLFSIMSWLDYKQQKWDATCFSRMGQRFFVYRKLYAAMVFECDDCRWFIMLFSFVQKDKDKIHIDNCRRLVCRRTVSTKLVWRYSTYKRYVSKYLVSVKNCRKSYCNN